MHLSICNINTPPPPPPPRERKYVHYSQEHFYHTRGKEGLLAVYCSVSEDRMCVAGCLLGPDTVRSPQSYCWPDTVCVYETFQGFSPPQLPSPPSPPSKEVLPPTECCIVCWGAKKEELRWKDAKHIKGKRSAIGILEKSLREPAVSCKRRPLGRLLFGFGVWTEIDHLWVHDCTSQKSRDRNNTQVKLIFFVKIHPLSVLVIVPSHRLETNQSCWNAWRHATVYRPETTVTYMLLGVRHTDRLGIWQLAARSKVTLSRPVKMLETLTLSMTGTMCSITPKCDTQR